MLLREWQRFSTCNFCKSFENTSGKMTPFWKDKEENSSIICIKNIITNENNNGMLGKMKMALICLQ